MPLPLLPIIIAALVAAITSYVVTNGFDKIADLLTKMHRHLTLVGRYEELVNEIEGKIDFFSSKTHDKRRWDSLQNAIKDFNNFLKEEISSRDLEIANAKLLSDNELILKQLNTLYNKIEKEKKEEKSKFDGEQIDIEKGVRKMQKDLTLAPFTMPFPQKPYSNSQEDLGYILKRLQNQRSEVLSIIRKAENVFKELEEVKKIHKDTIEGFSESSNNSLDPLDNFNGLADNSKESFNTLPDKYSPDSKIVQADGKEYVAVPRNINPALHTLNVLHDESSMKYEPPENPIFEKVAYDYFPIDEYYENNDFSV